MTPKIPIGAITDEFSPDLEVALEAMQEIGMSGAELRMISGKNIMDLSDGELDGVGEQVAARGFKVISIASPLFKCLLPHSPPVDSRFQHDVFAAKHTFEDQPRLAERAFFIAKKFGVRIIRVFSFWRTVRPEACLDDVLRELGGLAEKAAEHGLIIGLENEHACNIATGAETRSALDCLKHSNLGVVWDPANAYVSGENPFPAGYDDCVFAANWTVENAGRWNGDASRMVIAGDSAGGNLTAAAMLSMASGAHAPKLRAGVLIYGVFDFAELIEKSSNRPVAEAMARVYCGGHYPAALRDPRVSPQRGIKPGVLPPCFVICGTADLLLPQSRAVANALGQAGIEYEMHEIEDMPHAFMMMDALAGCREGQRLMFDFLRRHV